MSKILDACPSVFIGNSKDAAEIAYSLMIGLRSAVYFEENLSQEQARRLFLHSMLSMSGLE